MDSRFQEQLTEWDKAGLLRKQIPRDGDNLIDFGSNDYLGLSQNSQIANALMEGVQMCGNGSGSSRLVRGTTKDWIKFENHIAEWLQKEACIYFSSGYQMNVSIIPAVVEKGDYIFFDRLCHASLIDGIRLSGVQARSYKHNDLEDLKQKLLTITRKNPDGKVWVISEGIFSMDGDYGKIKELIHLKDRFGFSLMIDEAHSIGLIGSEGKGISYDLNVLEFVDIFVATCGKSFGLSGGFVAGSKHLIGWLEQKARGWMFSTAPPSFLAHGLIASLEIIRSENGGLLREKWRKNVEFFQSNLNTCLNFGTWTPIHPWIVGSSDEAVSLQTFLGERGYYTPAIRYPTVPKDKSRLRITISARQDTTSISGLTDLLNTYSAV